MLLAWKLYHKFAAVPVAAVTLEQGAATLMCLTDVSSEQTNMKHYETVYRFMFDLILSIYVKRWKWTRDNKGFKVICWYREAEHKSSAQPICTQRHDCQAKHKLSVSMMRRPSHYSQFQPHLAATEWEEWSDCQNKTRKTACLSARICTYCVPGLQGHTVPPFDI